MALRAFGALIFFILVAVVPALSPSPIHAKPDVVARHWVILDAGNGRVVAEQAAREPVAIASLTKVMTAVVALERGNLDQLVTVVPEDLVGESSAGLQAGQTVTLRTLLYGLLLRSGNDAAMAIARAVGGSPHREDPTARVRFVGWMNQKAAALGLSQTHFRNPHGLDEPGHQSSPLDLARLTRWALNDPRFVEIFAADRYESEGFSWLHTNRLPDRYPGVIGGKTGWTDEAGLCLIEVAERAGHQLVVVLTGSTFDAWYEDAARLLDYGWTVIDPIEEAEDAARLFQWWWQRADEPVASGLVQRSWLWGRPLGSVERELYREAPGGQRYVQYFEKGRMELTDPALPVDARWRVTGGRLAWELLTGRQQIGDAAVVPRAPAAIAVAGDPANPITYALLGRMAQQPPGTAGEVITIQLLPDGSHVQRPELAEFGVRYGQAFTETGHGMASIFAEWVEQRGLVRVGERLREEPLFSPWVALLGYPVTEPYWVRVPVAGVQRDVLVQCFERRCLTYTPANAPEWQVEMGNIGMHYRMWLAGRLDVPTLVAGHLG